ncbi:MAG TPA: hypothetical protein DCZ06_01755 [Alphaproteobacteria bacterium]|nr:hypothetical protein [Alphaproteobacteria bacterium]
MEIIWLGVPLWGYVVVGLLGGLVGIAELISRYPDSPVRAVATPPGIFYATINLLAAIAALAIGAVLSDTQPVPHETPHGEVLLFRTEDLLILLATAGFGALAFLRTKLITLRVGDADIGVGPSFILDTLLHAADRAVDRARAEPRAQLISDIMAPVSFEEAKLVLPTYCFAIMQNVSVEEQQKVALEIEALSGVDMPDRVKALNLGLLLLNIVGEHVLRIAVQNLEQEFAAAGRVLESVEQEMEGIDFDIAIVNLTPLCAELADMPEDQQIEVEYEVQRMKALSLTDQTRRYLFGLFLIKTFGADIVSKAIKAIRDDISLSEPPQPSLPHPAPPEQE